MFLINDLIRMVGLQFSFSNPDVIPATLKRTTPETQVQHETRKSRGTGVMVIQPVLDVSIAQFPADLEAAGFELVDAFYQARRDDNGRVYHMVRFLFVRKEHVQVSPEFQSRQAEVRSALDSIVLKAMWRVRAFDNPFYHQGEEVLGARMLSVNLEARNPLFQPNGEPVRVRAKDPITGQKIGEPQPLRAGKQLVMSDSRVTIRHLN